MTQTLLRLLERIRQRPEMYVGGSADNRAEQLRNLEHLVFGYQLALADHNIDIGPSFLSTFSAYLRETHGCSVSAGPIAAVLDMANDPQSAWELFWLSLKAFEDKHTPATN